MDIEFQSDFYDDVSIWTYSYRMILIPKFYNKYIVLKYFFFRTLIRTIISLSKKLRNKAKYHTIIQTEYGLWSILRSVF